jgi:Holliday junction resolvasome RuvABC DNA-binding subunit
MNPQPDPTVGNVVAIIFVLSIIFYTIQAINQNKTIQISDNFIIGYLESDPIIIQRNDPPNDFEKFDPNTPKTPVPTKSKEIDSIKSIDKQPFYTDCIDALVALGMKKKEARQTTKTVFETTIPMPDNLQSFLLTALKTK